MLAMCNGLPIRVWSMYVDSKSLVFLEEAGHRNGLPKSRFWDVCRGWPL